MQSLWDILYDNHRIGCSGVGETTPLPCEVSVIYGFILRINLILHLQAYELP